MRASFTGLRPGPRNLITDIAGISVGNAGAALVRSGVTVVLAAQAVAAGVDVRGGAPGTRETEALSPNGTIGTADAVVLAGGSVYGLDAASAVTAWLGARGRGVAVPGATIPAPIVPAAILFDLSNGGAKDWGESPPYAGLGRAAAEAAGADFALGDAGAGLGAVAGTYKGGLGSASILAAGGLGVGALVAVNAVGSAVVPGSAAFWAGPYEIDGEFGGRPFPAAAGASAGHPFELTKLARYDAELRASTTIAAVATNADLSPAETRRLAVMAQAGLTRAIRPAHTPLDGDVVFALATGTVPLPEPRQPALAVLGGLAADTLARAIARGVYEAKGWGAPPAYRAAHP
jgi:L-aminopeptidase/D-esterase-like protein